MHRIALAERDRAGGAGFHMSERDFLFYSFPGQEAPRRFTESRLEIPTPKTEFEKADLRRATWNPRKSRL